jgi:hypothetical protein
MANDITTLLPFRQYDDQDVVNMFAYHGVPTGAGLLVKVDASNANLNEDSVDLVNGGFSNTLGDAYSPLFVNPLKLAVATSGDTPLGILLRDIRATDENGENLRFYPQKREELQCVLSGQTVPVASRGIFTFTDDAFTGSAVPAPNTAVFAHANGKLGLTGGSAVKVGTVLATGSRIAGDAFAGNYAIVKIDV